MPAVSQFPQQMENKGGDASNDRSTIVVVGFIIILVTLHLAVLSYCQFRRRNDDQNSLSPSPFIRACPPPPPSLLSIILIYSQSCDPLQQGPATHLPNRSTTIPPAPVNHVFNYYDYSNSPYASANLSTFSYQNNGISRGDMKVAWAGASLELSGQSLGHSVW